MKGKDKKEEEDENKVRTRINQKISVAKVKPAVKLSRFFSLNLLFESFFFY